MEEGRGADSSMPGKRPRPLRRTTSVSLLGSGSFSHGSSPLLEHPKEKMKPTIKEPVPCAPRLVIGFNPKPSLECEIGTASVLSPRVASPRVITPTGSNEKIGSPRSGLESLLTSGRWDRREADGVGLGIVAALHSKNPSALAEEGMPNKAAETECVVSMAVNNAHNAHSHSSKPCQAPPPTQSRKQSHPIPILLPGMSPSSHGRSPCHAFNHPAGAQQHTEGDEHQKPAPPVQAWLPQADPDVNRCDTFLLGPSPVTRQRQYLNTANSSAVHFLDACYFCKRHLGEGKDIYMYR